MFCSFTVVIRRSLGILLLLLYLIPSIGISGYMHFCGGELASIVIIPTDEHPCACGPEEPMDDGCCKNKDFNFKIKDNHENAFVKFTFLTYDHCLPAIMGYAWSYTERLMSIEDDTHLLQEEEPPDKKLFKLHESYII